jgi:Domain of unknown function (DUF4114)/Metallo-peptidase family M12B Reprolysin-like/Calx-beta domain
MDISPTLKSDFLDAQELLNNSLQTGILSVNPEEYNPHEDRDDYLPIVEAAIDYSGQNSRTVELGTIDTSSAPASTTAVLDLSQTFLLSSLAGANQTIYLDFDGNTTVGTSWNNSYTAGAAIVTPGYSIDSDTTTFTAEELTAIQSIWQRVAEDFSPFNVNVTTTAPTDINDLIKSGTTDSRWGVRVAIGGSSTDWFGASAGGVAYLNSFNLNSDTPAFVFENQLGNGNEKYTAEAISHEIGHTLGLNHDGRITPVEGYYAGQGTGDTGWAPIMGVGYYQNLSQWSKGEYTAANNTEDDLQIITTKNGFGYRVDDTGNTLATAKALSISGGSVSGNGTIERNTDVDFYSFVAGAGAINLNIDPASRGANLDILAELYSADGTFIASSNPTTLLSANISTTLATAGVYYLKIDGVGAGDPLATGYSEYGSLGQYFISGNVGLSNLPGISLSVSPASVQEDGTTNLVYTFSRTGDTTTPLTVTYNVNGTATLGTDYTPIGADSFTATGGAITFAAGSSTAILTLDPTADTTIESNETIGLTLANAANYLVLTSTTAIGTIVNDDTPVVTLALAAPSVLEDGVNNLVYTFSRTGDTTNALAVNYQVAGTATFGTDYSQIGANAFSATAGKINFAAGSSTAMLQIDPTADITRESNETIALTLAADANYTIGTNAPITGTIIDDDLPIISVVLSTPSVLEDGTAKLLYTFTRTGATTNSLTVQYDVGGTATFKTDYAQRGASSFSSNTGKINFAAGSNTAILTIDPTADKTSESDETVSVSLHANSAYNIGTLSPVVGTILNDDIAAASVFGGTETALSPAIATASAPVENFSIDLSQMLSPSTQVSFSVEREAIFDNTVGFYQALDAAGSIQSSNGILKPTDAGYIEAAVANALATSVNLSVENHGTANLSAHLERSFYLPILVSHGTLTEAASGQKLDRTYTAFGSANADRTEHIRLLGNNTLGFEDMVGGGDRDYNDAIVKFKIG